LTIADIVSSRVIARDDHKECSTCHNATPIDGPYVNYTAAHVPRPYLPPVSYRGADDPDPGAPYIENNTTIGGLSWDPPLGGSIANNESWAREFISVTRTDSYAKPAYMKELFQKWLDDGAY
jgi:hypothetical protein